MGPTLIASFRHWLYRKEEFLLPKTPENGLFALKVGGNVKKKLKRKIGGQNSKKLPARKQKKPKSKHVL